MQYFGCVWMSTPEMPKDSVRCSLHVPLSGPEKIVPSGDCFNRVCFGQSSVGFAGDEGCPYNQRAVQKAMTVLCTPATIHAISTQVTYIVTQALSVHTYVRTSLWNDNTCVEYLSYFVTFLTSWAF